MPTRRLHQAVIAVAIGCALGIGSRCYVASGTTHARDADAASESSQDRESQQVARPSGQRNTRGEPTRSTGGGSRGSQGFEPPWRVSATPLAAMEPGEPRDEPWAKDMEGSIAAFSRANLEALFPEARWDGVTCHSTFCELTYAVPEGEAEAAKRATLLLVGVGVRVQRGADAPEEGMVTQRIRYRMMDVTTGIRTSGAEFAESQRAFAERFPERVAAIRAGVELDRTGTP